MSSTFAAQSLGFRVRATSGMFQSDYHPFEGWSPGEILPYGDIQLSPAAAVLNYGQSLFEGLKAYRTARGAVQLFRPQENAKRMLQGAERLCMPGYPIDAFVSAVAAVVDYNREYVPPYGQGSLYLRPCLWATGETLAIEPPATYTFLVYASPVGEYYRKTHETLRVRVARDVHRAAPKGTGHIKYAGNYAGVMQHERQAKVEGYQAVLYLDAQDNHYVEEVGSANLFCVRDGCLYTPQSDSILKGITRDTIMHLARAVLGVEVVEKRLTIEELWQADECFCSGTAAAVSAIGELADGERHVIFGDGGMGPLTQKIHQTLTAIQRSDCPSPCDDWLFTVAEKIDLPQSQT